MVWLVEGVGEGLFILIVFLNFLLGSVFSVFSILFGVRFWEERFNFIIREMVVLFYKVEVIFFG